MPLKGQSAENQYKQSSVLLKDNDQLQLTCVQVSSLDLPYIPVPLEDA